MRPQAEVLLQRAAVDPQLGAAHLRTLIRLLPTIDRSDFVPVKLVWLARQIGMDESTVTRTIDRLTELGYIVRDRTGSGRVIHGYRLPA